MKTYFEGIVGESNYQSAIKRCSAGDTVRIEQEPDNQFDPKALRVVSAKGQTIGYIGRKSWLQDAIHKQKKTVRAEIKSIGTGGTGKLGVVLTVTLLDDDANAETMPAEKPSIGSMFRKLFGG